MGVVFLLENLEVVINQPKAELMPTQEIEFLGFSINSTAMELKLSGEKRKKRKKRQAISCKHNSHSVHAVQTHREDKCSHSGHSHGPTLLQEFPVLPPRGSARIPELHFCGDTNRKCQGGTGVVTRPLHSVEWWESNLPQQFPHHRDRCLNKRVGSSVQRGTNRETVDCRRTSHAHKLSGTACSTLGNQVLYQTQNQSHHHTEDGQYVSVYIHQQTRGNDIPISQSPGQATMVVVYEEEYPPQSSTSAGCCNTIADNESRVMKDRSNWKLCPVIFHKINQRLGPLEVDLFASRLPTNYQSMSVGDQILWQ